VGLTILCHRLVVYPNSDDYPLAKDIEVFGLSSAMKRLTALDGF
jgi:hypothetical protein